MKTYRKTFALDSFIINRPYVQRLIEYRKT